MLEYSCLGWLWRFWAIVLRTLRGPGDFMALTSPLRGPELPGTYAFAFVLLPFCLPLSLYASYLAWLGTDTVEASGC